MSLLGRRHFIAGSGAMLASLAAPSTGSVNLGTDTGLRFFVVGDWGRRGRHFQRDVAAAMGTYARTFHPKFVLTTGDNFYEAGVPTETSIAWDLSFEDIYTADTLQEPPWYAVLGNHDYAGSVGAQLARSGNGRWRMPEKWYPLGADRHGDPDVELFLIDTVTWEGRESFWWGLQGDPVTPGEPEEQEAWLEQRLRDSKARMKLVVGHHPIYSIGKHGGAKRLRCLDRLLCTYGVTAYICGHDHAMYHISRRRAAMDAGRLHYICSGAGSQMLSYYTGGQAPGCTLKLACTDAALPTTPVWHSFLADGSKMPAAQREAYDAPGAFAAIEAFADRIKVQFIDGLGRIRHNQTAYAVAPPSAPTCKDDLETTIGGDPQAKTGPKERCLGRERAVSRAS